MWVELSIDPNSFMNLMDQRQEINLCMKTAYFKGLLKFSSKIQTFAFSMNSIK